MKPRREADRKRWVPYMLVAVQGTAVYAPTNYTALNVAVVTTNTLLKMMGKL